MGVILTPEERALLLEKENRQLNAQLDEANQIIAEQSDALIELAEIIEEVADNG